MSKKSSPEYFCVGVKRNYEDTWRIISKHDTQAEAQAEIDKRRAYTGVFNYDNAEFRVISRTKAKEEFGPRWEYKPIGTKDETKAAKS
jgi:hypothetical protein